MGNPTGDRLIRLVHDLRTPLTIIAGFAELLERGSGTLTEEQRDEYIGRIADAAREMKRILDDERDERLRPPGPEAPAS